MDESKWKYPRFFGSVKNRIIFLSLTFLVLSIFIINSNAQKSQSLRSSAEPGGLPFVPRGCWYEKPDPCPYRDPQTGRIIPCKPILICPTATPTVTLTPTVTPTDTPIPSDTPVPSGTPIPTVTPTDTPVPTPTDVPGGAYLRCIPRPICLYESPPCTLPEPANGWCPSIELTCSSCMLNDRNYLCIDARSRGAYCSFENISETGKVACISCIRPSPTATPTYIPPLPPLENSPTPTP